MTDVAVQPLEEGAYGVALREGDVTTHHRVVVPDAMVDELGLADVDREDLVRESFEFLLEREPAASIQNEFALDEIAAYFPEYFDEIQKRVGAKPPAP